MKRTKFTSILTICLSLFMTSALARSTFSCGQFSNAGRFTGDIDLTVTKSFNNTGYVSVTNITITDQSIRSPADKKLGNLCWKNDFTLNGVLVNKSYARCEGELGFMN